MEWLVGRLKYDGFLTKCVEYNSSVVEETRGGHWLLARTAFAKKQLG